MAAGLEKRGPRIGDAASLWNFTPAPGWTKEEAQILKLCLMKHGVGRWIQILETGLLPGKLIQQLNGQTQRLLGQQSLAAYTGLQVDIDRIRADNDRLVDAERKNGLVINSGPNLVKQQKQQLQEEAKAKYGLSEAELQEVEEQLQELAAARGAPLAGAASMRPEAKAAAAGGLRERSQRDAELLARETATLSRDQKMNFLLHLHERLQQTAARLARAVQQHPAAAATGPAALPLGYAAPSLAAAAMAAGGGATRGAAAALLFGRSAENQAGAANAAAPAELGAVPRQPGVVQPGPAAVGKPAGGVARGAGGKRKAGAGRRPSQAASSDTESDDGEWEPEPRSGGSGGCRGTRSAALAAAMDVDEPGFAVAASAAAGGKGGGRGRSCATDDRRAAAAAAAAADIEQLVGMGFSKRQARDALEECSYDVAAAVEWLVANCLQ